MNVFAHLCSPAQSPFEFTIHLTLGNLCLLLCKILGGQENGVFTCDFIFSLILKIFLLYNEAVHKMLFTNSGQTKSCFFKDVIYF